MFEIHQLYVVEFANFAAAPFKKGDIGIRLQAYEDIINLLLFWQRKGFLLKVGNLERREK